jgi:hypothetical protein
MCLPTAVHCVATGIGQQCGRAVVVALRGDVPAIFGQRDDGDGAADSAVGTSEAVAPAVGRLVADEVAAAVVTGCPKAVACRPMRLTLSATVCLSCCTTARAGEKPLSAVAASCFSAPPPAADAAVGPEGTRGVSVASGHRPMTATQASNATQATATQRRMAMTDRRARLATTGDRPRRAISCLMSPSSPSGAALR